MIPKNIPALTEVELKIMTSLWKIAEGPVQEVMKVMARKPPLAYTSVSTMLRILEKKKFVTARKEGKAHIYIPLISKKDYENFGVQNLIEKVFEGNPLGLLRNLVHQKGLSEKERETLRHLFAPGEKP